MKLLGFVVFTITQLISIPLVITAVFVVTYRQMYISRRLGVSSTGIEVINGRWTMHVFGLREDIATTKLLRTLPNSSLTSLWVALFPLYLLYRISGENLLYPTLAAEGEEGIKDLVTSRTLYFDELIEKSLDDVEQFVQLGAGYDTRAYGRLNDPKLKFFELDQEATQQLKIDCLKKSGIETSHVSFVAVDFSNEDWYEKLALAGYDETKKTIFLWEGVTLYLGRSDVLKTLREIRQHSPAGSRIIADFYAESFVKGDYMPGMKTANATLKLTDEELIFGLDMSGDFEQQLETFAVDNQLNMGRSYFLASNSSRGPFSVVAELST